MAYTTINKSTDYFNTKLYTGTGAGQSITGVGFQPDWSWIKIRNTSDSHVLVDAVRGATKFLQSNNSSAETTSSSFVQAFTSDGLTLGGNQGTSSASNTYASWNWKANGSGSANTDGSINSTVSVNTTAGFSIVKWTGTGANATVGHGLGAVPKIIITKSIASSNWGVYHESLGNTDAVFLNETSATGSSSNYWNNTSPTSSVFYLGNGGTNGGSTNNTGGMIAYCFADKTGYSKFGSYVGNGNADGTFVYTGFKPAFVMVKKSSASGSDWNLHHNKSPGFNVNDNYLAPNSSASEVTNNSYQIFDLLSNGFKCRGTGAGTNASGETHIYMAFGQSLVGSNNVPCTAR